MNPEYEHQLEGGIDHELKLLPPISAPAELRQRVMEAIAARNKVPLRAGAQMWPARARAGLFLVLAAAFVLGTLILNRALGQAPVADFIQYSIGLYDILASLLSALEAVRSALAVAVKHLGAPVLAGLIVAAALSYLILVGAGAACYRLSLAFTTRKQ